MDDWQLFLRLSPGHGGRQCGEGDTRSSDDHPGLSRAARARLDDDLHAAAEQDKESHEPVQEEAGEASPLERRDLGLIDFENLGRLLLGEAAALDDGTDLPRQFRRRQGFRGSRVAEVREHVGAADDVSTSSTLQACAERVG